MNLYKIVFEDNRGKRRMVCTWSKHMSGAVRRLYQENNVERIVAIAQQ